MNTATTLALHTANQTVQFKPLHAVLADMRASFERTSPGSLGLFNLFEPWVLEWAVNPNALTNPLWLAERWRSFVFWRVDQILADIQRHCRNPQSPDRRELRAAMAALRDFLRALGGHFAAQHPRVVATCHALGRFSGYLLAGSLFLLCQVLGLDLGDRFYDWWKG